MKKFAKGVILHRKKVIGLFVCISIISIFAYMQVRVNYDIMEYLPDDVPSTAALDVMNEEYDNAIPNLRVMVKVNDMSEALSYKEQVKQIKGVDAINWLDDVVNIYEPMELVGQDTVNKWYKDGNALFDMTIQEENQIEVIKEIRTVIGEGNAISGTAVVNALSPITTAKEIRQIMLFVIPLVFVILLLTTSSWFEPILFMMTIGVAIILNNGTNWIFGEISFVTNAAGSVLQLAVSMDYSIFLLHRFQEYRESGLDVKDAMINAVKKSFSSILSSGFTTVTGFAALILMRFKIGPDMGYVMAKAIVFSLLCVIILLPALAVSTYKLIDKTVHKPIIPSFKRFSEVSMKINKGFAFLFFIVLIPSYLASQNNDFIYGVSKMYEDEGTQLGRDMNAINAVFGESSSVVVMVPKGDVNQEKKLNEKLKKLPCVDSVISYVNSVGMTIPAEYIPEHISQNLYSENYSRFILYLNITESDPDPFHQIEDIGTIAEKYYGDTYHMAGVLVNTKDLKDTVVKDTVIVNGVAIAFVFLILIINFKSISIPVILTVVIEASIWLNLTIPYFMGERLNYLAYLIISSIQLGATIDYAILFTDRFIEYRKKLPKKEAMRLVLQNTTVSILTSSSILTLAGMILGKVSSNSILSQLGYLIGRGAIISTCLVLFVLPVLLMAFEYIVYKTTIKANFYKEDVCYDEK